MFLLAFWALESLSQNQKAKGTILSHVLKLSKFLPPKEYHWNLYIGAARYYSEWVREAKSNKK